MTDSLPTCFGTEWSANEPECAGGADANFIHPKTGLHNREQCNFFQACGARTQAKRLSAQAQLLPAQQLLRPTTPQPVTPTVQPQPAQASVPQVMANGFAEYMRRQQAAQVEAQRQAALQANRPGIPATQPAPNQVLPQQPGSPPLPATAYQHPAPVYQLNYMMPGYLSVPEVRHEGEGLMPVLFREVVRSTFKALGHSVSHFFDVRVMKP